MEDVTHLWNQGKPVGQGGRHTCMLTREKPRKILGPAHPLPTPLDSTAEGLRAGTRGREPQRRPLLSTRGCDDTDGLLSEDSQAQTLSTGSSA